MRRGRKPPFTYMGLFSKTKHFVSAQTLPLIGETEDPMKESMIEAILDNRNYTDQLMDDSLNGMGLKLSRVFRYAQNHYTYGTPNGFVEAFDLDKASVQQVLESIEGTAVNVVQIEMDYGTSTNFVTTWLVDNRNYNIGSGAVDPIQDILAIQSTQLAATTATAEAELSTDSAAIKAGIDGVTSTTDTSSVVEFRDPDYYLVQTDTTTTVTTTATVTADPLQVSEQLGVVYDGNNSQLLDPGTGLFEVAYAYTLDQVVTKTFQVSTEEVTVVDTAVTETLCDASGVPLLDGEGNPQDQVVNSYSGSPTSSTTTAVEQTTTPLQFSGGVTEGITLPIPDKEHIFIHAKYYIDDGNGGALYKSWDYDIESGIYPALNRGTGVGIGSSFFPFVPIRLNNVDMTDSSRIDTELYQTSKTMLRKLNISFEDLGKGVNDNPDKDDIDHAYVFFGTNLRTENEACIRYLAMFFDRMSHSLTYSLNDYDKALNPDPEWHEDLIEGSGGWYIPPQRLPPINVIAFQDAQLRLELRCHYINVQEKTGIIGKKGTTVRTITVNPPGFVCNQNAEDIWCDRYDQSYVTFQYQETVGTYKEITVHGLEHVNFIYENKNVTTSLDDTGDKEGNFMIPLQYSVIQDMPLLVRNHLYRDAVHMIFNSHEAVKVKWYQTNFFKVVVQAFSLYVMFTTGMDLMAGFRQALLQGATAALKYVIKKIVIGLVINAAFRLVVRIIGIEAAMIIGFFAALGGFGQTLRNGSLAEAPWAEELLMIANGLGTAVTKSIQDELADLLMERKLFQEEVKSKSRELEDANKLLDNDSLLDPFFFIDPISLFNPDETPDEFYNRTVHSGNIGAMVFDAITHYVDTKLELPKNRQIVESDFIYE